MCSEISLKDDRSQYTKLNDKSSIRNSYDKTFCLTNNVNISRQTTVVNEKSGNINYNIIRFEK